MIEEVLVTMQHQKLKLDRCAAHASYDSPVEHQRLGDLVLYDLELGHGPV